ncbi:MAG TPA: ATPase, T2SS/T4P/T4SS family, partial [archaeon]|nr:ATPase, T2SS/T4P/T4SS family [archaeon]
MLGKIHPALRGAIWKKRHGVKKPKPAPYPALPLREPRFLVPLPTFKNIADTDVRYPLIEPLAFAHIAWDPDQKQLVYELEEPVLSPEDRELLQKIEVNLTELIDVKISVLKDRAGAIDYLTTKVTDVLAELGLALPPGQYVSIMYYIIRDFVGLNDIEPLMYDPYIEDIGCTGADTPLYIVHRKYGSIETSLRFRDFEYLSNFVIKLSERCGRYISYANPLLDGSLPDGSRVQASLAKDVTTKGPTFSIRKFRKNPFSPTDLINNGTTNASMLAYLWILMEHGASVLLSGGVSVGKCISPTDLIQLADGELITAQDLHERSTKTATPATLLTLSPNPLHLKPAQVNTFWKRRADTLYSVRTTSGASLSSTAEHPFYCLRNSRLCQVPASELRPGDWVATARSLPIQGAPQALNLLRHPLDLYARDSITLVRELARKTGKTNADLAKALGVSLRALLEWKAKNAIPLAKLAQLSGLAGVPLEQTESRIRSLSAKTSPKDVRRPSRLTPALAAIAGYVIGDGHLAPTQTQFCNSSPALRARFRSLVSDTFGIPTKTSFPKGRVPFEAADAKVVTEILSALLEIPRGNKAARVRVPRLVQRSPPAAVSAFLSALFDCEGSVSKKQCAVEFSTASRELSQQLPFLLLRFGVVSRIREKPYKGRTYYRLWVSGKENLCVFERRIGFHAPEKARALRSILSKTHKHITNVDLIPVANLLAATLAATNVNHTALARASGLTRECIRDVRKGRFSAQRRTLQKIADGFSQLGIDTEDTKTIAHLARSDLLWDRVRAVEKVPNPSGAVYDVTVDGTHNFVAGNAGGFIVSNTSLLNVISVFIPPEAKIISIEDTREIALPHENWIPSVARTGFGIPEPSGKRYGEIDLFDLLRESFRQNPDYVIVGEVRGQEANVMFQGISSGHPSLGTIHAGSIDDVIKRLETPPISLSPTLIESLDVILIMIHAHEKGKSARRIKELSEIQSVDPATGRAHTIRTFSWLPAEDQYKENILASEILHRIAFEKGIPYQSLLEELESRRKALEWMKRYDITNFE